MLSVNSASTAHELPLVLNFVVAVLLLAFTVALQRRVNLSLVYQLLIPIAIVLSRRCRFSGMFTPWC